MLELKIDNLSKSYNGNYVLKDFSITMSPGIYGLIGPNGAGKTTLISCIAGLLQADSGSVTTKIDNNSYSGIPEKYFGYLPQTPMFYKNFTAYEFLKYMCMLKNVDVSDTYIKDLLTKVNLLSSADKKIGAFSGGMRQRLGIAQAVIGNPKVLIFDEPTAGLDPQERIRFRNVISSLGADKIVLLATHIVTDIAFIAKEVILIQNGELIKKSSQQELTESINGKVWEVDVEPLLVSEYMNKYFISNIQNSDSETILRIISDNQPDQKATAVTPNMEDVCIYYFGK